MISYDFFSLTLSNLIISRSIHLAAKTLFHFFYSWVIFHCIYVPHLLYPFFHQWTFRFLLCLGCYKSNTFFFFFLGPCLQYIEVPRLGVKSELQLLVYLHHSHSNVGLLTHWAKPGIEPASSWILVGFVSAEPQQNFHKSNTFWQSIFSLVYSFTAWEEILLIRRLLSNLSKKKIGNGCNPRLLGV